MAHGWSPIASHRFDVTLAPGATEEFIFVLGYVENEPEEKFEMPGQAGHDERSVIPGSTGNLINKAKALRMMDAFATPAQVEAAFAELKTFWDGLLGRFTLQSNVPELDRTVNIWNQYQCMITFFFSRSASYFESGIGRGMGFRDSNQDLAGIVHLIPERARQRILDIAATQFPDGGCYHQYQPLTKRGNNDIGGGFNDDPLWLIFGTVAYIRETGDFSLLDEQVPFDNKPGTEVSMLDHLKISFKHVTDNLGPHGLPLIGRADWNDCLNLNCFSDNPDESFQTTENKSEGSKAESLMIAGLFVAEGRDFAELLEKIGDGSATGVKEAVKAMEEAVKKHGWDGEWFLRAYDYYGNKIEKVFTLYGDTPLLSIRFALNMVNPEFNVLGPQPILEVGKAHDPQDKIIVLEKEGLSDYHVDMADYWGKFLFPVEGWNVDYDPVEDVYFAGAFPVDQPFTLHMWHNHPRNRDTRFYYCELQPWMEIFRHNTTYFSYYMWAGGGSWEDGVQALRDRNLITEKNQ